MAELDRLPFRCSLRVGQPPTSGQVRLTLTASPGGSLEAPDDLLDLWQQAVRAQAFGDAGLDVDVAQLSRTEGEGGATSHYELQVSALPAGAWQALASMLGQLVHCGVPLAALDAETSPPGDLLSPLELAAREIPVAKFPEIPFRYLAPKSFEKGRELDIWLTFREPLDEPQFEKVDEAFALWAYAVEMHGFERQFAEKVPFNPDFGEGSWIAVDEVRYRKDRFYGGAEEIASLVRVAAGLRRHGLVLTDLELDP